MQKFTQSREKRSFFYAKSIFVVNFYTLASKKSIFTHCVKKDRTLNTQYKSLVILIKTLNIRNTTKSAEPGFHLAPHKSPIFCTILRIIHHVSSLLFARSNAYTHTCGRSKITQKYKKYVSYANILPIFRKKSSFCKLDFAIRFPILKHCIDRLRHVHARATYSHKKINIDKPFHQQFALASLRGASTMPP
jgi:hypothetical protein